MQRSEMNPSADAAGAVADTAAGGGLRRRRQGADRPGRRRHAAGHLRPGVARAGRAADGRAARGLHGDAVLQRRAPGHRRRELADQAPGPRPGRRLGLRGRRRGRGGRRRVLVRVRRVRLHLPGHARRLGERPSCTTGATTACRTSSWCSTDDRPDQGPRAHARSRARRLLRREPRRHRARSRAAGPAATAATPNPRAAGAPHRRPQPRRSRAATCWRRSTSRSRGSW